MIIAETSENVLSDLNNSIANRARSCFSRSAVSQKVYVDFTPVRPFESLPFLPGNSIVEYACRFRASAAV